MRSSDHLQPGPPPKSPPQSDEFTQAGDPENAERPPALLCISQSFAPNTTPTAIRASELLAQLSARWRVAVVTEARSGDGAGAVRVRSVRSRRPTRVFALLRRLRLGKLIELLVWPDESIFWTLPAILAGRRLIKELAPSAIVVFMMPYSAGLVGVVLARISGLPLIVNLDDSLTCTDMHPYFPTRLHYRLARRLEDFYAARADAVVYVSQTNLDAVRARNPASIREKFRLVRYGAADVDASRPPQRSAGFEIAYVGAMSGWWALIDSDASSDPLKRLFRAWTQLGRHELTRLEQRTSSPAVIGAAITEAIGEHPDWSGRVRLQIHGNPYPAEVVAQALARSGLEQVVAVGGPVPHERVAAILADADLLFLTLPKRLDGSRGGRISAKTYEYLASDRPILAAVPPGENWDYLEGRPGVWLLDPEDREGMREVIVQLAAAKFAGAPQSFDRTQLRAGLSYEARAGEFDAAVRAGIARHAQRR